MYSFQLYLRNVYSALMVAYVFPWGQQGSRKRLKVAGAENQIPLICSEIPEFSWVVMDFCGCKTALLKKCGCSCTNCTHPYATPRLDLTRLTLPHYFVAKIVLIMSFFVD